LGPLGLPAGYIPLFGKQAKICAGAAILFVRGFMRRVLVSICLLSLSCCVAEFCQAQIPGVPPYPTNRDSAPQPGQIPGVPPYPMNRRPAPQPAQKPAVARAVVNYPPDRNDPIAMRCDQLADSPIDPQRIGDGVQFGQIDVKEALPACQQAAARQPARPRYQLLYGCVLHAAQRYNEAARYYALADNAGYALAAYYLGTLYDAGTGVKQDFSKASDLYFRAGNAGFADAFADGGMLYMREQQPDYAEAKRWFESAAQGGSNQGLIDLGWLYENGYGVQKDPLKGGSFYNEAAQHGDTEGMLRLGDLYLAGRGVQPDPHTACQWFFGPRRGEMLQPGWTWATATTTGVYISWRDTQSR
jgi:hypothetical protein